MTTLEPAKEFSRTVGINVARNGGLFPYCTAVACMSRFLAALAAVRAIRPWARRMAGEQEVEEESGREVRRRGRRSVRILFQSAFSAK
jgi:hypothetical protein